ncbi:MAG: glutathionyl-hydroquinone reductase [Solirubrobacteraceae bacterium]|jgi:putative glutathione S-transferase|nr:glutathionyl-hydroquinone reductase [Solirubrobacteraceae bacterium]
MTSPTSARDGAFRRQDSKFRDWPDAIVAGRYHLYVSYACPWAHRTIIARELMGLQDAIGMSVVDPYRDDDPGWAFTGGEYTDPVNGFATLRQAYLATEPDFDMRVSVPVLWDTEEGRIVNNESADILRMFSTVFEPLADSPVKLAPEHLIEDIDELNARIYDEVNNAVYKAGFTTRQEIYEREVRGIFALLDELDERLEHRRFLFGDAPLETDWRLFTTLVRFDAVYAIHFKCSLKRIVDYANLWPYLRDLYQWPGVAETVRFDEFRRHYYGTHPSINPNGLLALRPDEDFDAPHGRG